MIKSDRSFLSLFLVLILCTPLFSAENPIDEEIDYSGYFITNVKVIHSVPGSFNNPGSLTFRYQVTDKNGISLPFLASSNMRLQVGSKTVRNFLFQYDPDGYRMTVPRLPYQEKDGTYPLRLSLLSRGKTVSSKQFPVKYHSPSINLILVIDTSTSMLLNDPDNRRREAVRNIIRYATSQGVISKVAIVKFSSTASVILPLIDVKTMGEWEPILDKIDSQGETAIGDALEKAYGELVKTDPKEKSIVILLTDGENNGPWKDNHKVFSGLQTPVYTVGLTGSVNAAFLSKISSDTGGDFFQIADSFRIQSVYSRILNQEMNRKTFLSTELSLKPGQSTNLFFQPDSTLGKMNVYAFSSTSNLRIGLKPELVKFDRTVSKNFEAFGLKSLKPKRHEMRLENRSSDVSRVSLEAFVASKVFVEFTPLKSSYGIAEPVSYSVQVYQDDTPLLVDVRVRISRGKANWTMKLYDDGLHGDGKKRDGVYRDFFIPQDEGRYSYHLEIAGKNLYGENFGRSLNGTFEVRIGKSDWEVAPLKIRFGKAGAIVDCYQSFELVDLRAEASPFQAVKVIPFPLKGPENISAILPVSKPDNFILEAGRKKLFNVHFRLPTELPDGLYEGRIILEMGETHLDVPLQIDFQRYRIPENNDFVPSLQVR